MNTNSTTNSQYASSRIFKNALVKLNSVKNIFPLNPYRANTNYLFAFLDSHVTQCSTSIFKLKPNSIKYHNFIKKKLPVKKRNFTTLKHIILIFSLLSYFILSIFDKDETFSLNISNWRINIVFCAPEDYPPNEEHWNAQIRKKFANSAKNQGHEAVLEQTRWEIIPDRPYITLTLSRQRFWALKAYHVNLSTPIDSNDLINFDMVPTRHVTIRDIVKVTSPNYIPTIRHYQNLKSREAIESEANFLFTVELDPHILDNPQYESTFRKASNKFRSDFLPAEPYEREYLDFISTQLNHSPEEKEQLRMKYFAARFYGQFLDFTVPENKK